MSAKIPERHFPPRCPICRRFLCDVASPHCDWLTHPRCEWMRCQCGAIIRQDGKAIAFRDGKWIGTEAVA